MIYKQFGHNGQSNQILLHLSSLYRELFCIVSGYFALLFELGMKKNRVHRMLSYS